MSPAETDRGNNGTGQDEGISSRRRSRARLVDAVVVVAVLVAAVAGWFFFVRDSGPASPPAPVLEAVIETPVSGAVDATDWSSPSAVAIDGERIYVLDMGNNRILSMDYTGVVDNIICETDDCAFLLDAPMDMEFYDGLFYVANTEKGEVDVITSAGVVVRTYELPVEPGLAPRATGVHVAQDGSVYVSDWTSGKIAIFEPDGEFQMYFGEDTVGIVEFTDPTGLTVDDEGNLYVAEFSLGMARKFAPNGRELAAFSMMGGDPTKASEVTDLVVDGNGFLYLADQKRSLVHTFSRGARYVGFVGLLDGTRIDSPIAITGPQGLAVFGSQIFIVGKDGLHIYTVDVGYFEYRVDGDR